MKILNPCCRWLCQLLFFVAVFTFHINSAHAVLKAADFRHIDLIKPPLNLNKNAQDYSHLNIINGIAFLKSSLLFNIGVLESDKDKDLLPKERLKWIKSLFNEIENRYGPSTGIQRIPRYLNPRLLGKLIGFYVSKQDRITTKKTKSIGQEREALINKLMFGNEEFKDYLKKERVLYCKRYKNNTTYQERFFKPKDKIDKLKHLGTMDKKNFNNFCTVDNQDNFTKSLDDLLKEGKILSYFSSLFRKNLRLFFGIFQGEEVDLIVILTLEALAVDFINEKKDVLPYYSGLKEGLKNKKKFNIDIIPNVDDESWKNNWLKKEGWDTSDLESVANKTFSLNKIIIATEKETGTDKQEAYNKLLASIETDLKQIHIDLYKFRTQ